MRRPLLLTSLAAVAATGCSSSGELAIRAKPAPLAEGRQSADFRVAEARSQFALGNVALALQGFRAALRENPESVDALNGMAACYDRMGRFDLSRRHYEQALALAPADQRLYANLATSLELQGDHAQAAAVRAEAAVRLAAAAQAAAPPARVAEAVDAASAPVVAAAVAPTAPLPAPLAAAPAAVSPKRSPPATASPAPPPATPAAPAPSITVALAPVAPAAPSAPSRVRLERVSLAEVELVTKARPIWRSEVVSRSARSTTVAFRPVQPRVTLLNAARVQGLAARTRALLEQRGWRQVRIGNAPQVLRTSALAYPAERRSDALRLARQFDFGLRHQPSEQGTIVVLLGRDAAATLKRSSGA